jgi:murein DD-endopeptidase MepM/ murein hydrolase activator NlpD
VLVEPRTYKKQVIKGVPQKTVTPNPAQDKQIAKEAAAIKASRTGTSALSGFAGSWKWPVTGPISGVYGSSRTYNGVERNWHKGLDIARPIGTPVNAPADGKVVFAMMTFLNGNLIVLDHGQQLFTVYAHLNKMAVKVGDSVKQGEHIGDIGTTGRSTGPHLHWGLFWKQEALDPGLLIGVAPDAQ